MSRASRSVGDGDGAECDVEGVGGVGSAGWARVFALVGAAAMLGAGMQAPLTALVLILEITHTGFGLTVPLAIATALATAVARRVDGYSIYSGRLAAVPPP